MVRPGCRCAVVVPPDGEKKVQLKLKVLGGSHNGEEVLVSGPKFFIGRDRDCQLRPNSDVVSRHHCALVIDDGYVGIRDFNSKNGTFVDGNRVVGEQELRSGSELVVGPLRFLVQLDMSVGGKKRSRVETVQEAAERTSQLAEGEDKDIDSWLDDTDPGSSDTNLGASKSGMYRRADAAHASDTGKIDTGKIDTGKIDTDKIDTDKIDTDKIDTGQDSKILSGDSAQLDPADGSGVLERQSPDVKAPDVKVPGKLPHSPEDLKEKSEDTQAAVNDVLRKLREKKKKQRNQ